MSVFEKKSYVLIVFQKWFAVNMTFLSLYKRLVLEETKDNWTRKSCDPV